MANDDINQIIESAVNARVEAAVLEAMSSSEVMGRFVTAALSKPVSTGSYSEKNKPLITHLLHNAIEEQTKAVVSEQIAELRPIIAEDVRKALKKSVGVISDSLVDGLVSSAAGRYPSIKVDFGNAS